MKYQSAPWMNIRIRPLDYAALASYLRERAAHEPGDLGRFLDYVVSSAIEPALGDALPLRHAHYLEQGEAQLAFLRRAINGLEPEEYRDLNQHQSL
jgi:hypothetical protein